MSENIEIEKLEAYITKVCEFARCKRDDFYEYTVDPNISLAKGRTLAYCRDVLGWSTTEAAHYLEINEKTAHVHLKNYDMLFPQGVRL